MRLAGQIKGGYYPAHPEAVAAAMARIEPAPDEETTVFDPCAGRGDAIRQIGDILHATPFACELSEDRAAVLRENLPVENVLAPASFFGCRFSAGFASLVWCNPPFDDEMGGGGRVELRFVEHCLSLLRARGVLCLVCPESVAEDYDTLSLLVAHFEPNTMSVMPFPDHVRKYNEVVVFGRKRDKPQRERLPWQFWETIVGRTQNRYYLPPGKRPLIWRKVELSQEEMFRALRASRLTQMLGDPPELPLPRPPMSPGAGHRAMLLASGCVDGLVCPPGEPPHVVRGTCGKQKYLSSHSETENEDGSTTEKTVYSEKMVLVVRAIDAEGTIHNLTSGGTTSVESESETRDEE